MLGTQGRKATILAILTLYGLVMLLYYNHNSVYLSNKLLVNRTILKIISSYRGNKVELTRLTSVELLENEIQDDDKREAKSINMYTENKGIAVKSIFAAAAEKRNIEVVSTTEVTSEITRPTAKGTEQKNLTAIPPKVEGLKTQAEIEDKPGVFHILVFLSIFNGEIWPKYEKFTAEQREARDAEVIEALSYNLNHTMVKNIHLFYYTDRDLQAIQNFTMHNKEKIIPFKLGHLIHMADFFLYASRYLVDQPVIAMNGDIVLGTGFEKIDTLQMRDSKVIFSLTRYGDIKGRCKEKNICQKGAYHGSHDTHIFRLAEPLNETTLISKLDYPTNLWGAESGMMVVMQGIFKYKVHNPCLVLKTHHHHCTPLHGPTHHGQYSVIGREPFNITYWDVYKSGYGMSGIENALIYSNGLNRTTQARLRTKN